MIREIEAFGLQQNVAVPTDGAGLIPFREDSAATKAFKIYARVTGLPYLFDTLGQIINDFCAVLDEEAKKEAVCLKKNFFLILIKITQKKPFAAGCRQRRVINPCHRAQVDHVLCLHGGRSHPHVLPR